MSDTTYSLPRIVPMRRFIILSITTFGLYTIRWTYQSWKLLRYQFGENVSPFWRTFFSIVQMGSLATHLKQHTTDLPSSKTISPGLIGGGYMICLLLQGGNGTVLPILAILGSVVPFIPLVRAQNDYLRNQANTETLPISGWTYVLMALGCMLWMMVIIGLILH